MSWYIHPSKQLRDDELPPELVVTNGNGSIIQAYVPYRKCHNTDVGTEGYFKCSACGESCSVEWEYSGWDEPRFCPNCGAEVVCE